MIQSTKIMKKGSYRDFMINISIFDSINLCYEIFINLGMFLLSGRGMWTVKPSGWPERAPFCDPNSNKWRDPHQPNAGHAKKPEKDVLVSQLEALVELYQVYYKEVVISIQLHCFVEKS